MRPALEQFLRSDPMHQLRTEGMPGELTVPAEHFISSVGQFIRPQQKDHQRESTADGRA
jgi:hypothetical protein